MARIAMREKYWILLVLFSTVFFSAEVCLGKNISVENISLLDKDTVKHTYDIQFDISWDKSWFITGAPSAKANWDAAWVFVKYSTYSNGSWSNWAHCTLLKSGSVVPKGSQMSFGATGTIYKGAFIYRCKAGIGLVDWNNAKIRWDYRADAVADDAVVKVKVFAIEMVYIPKGEFYAGDGTNRIGGSNSHFFDAADNIDPRNPVLISSTQPYISNVNDGTGIAGDITWGNESHYAGNLPVVRTRLGANYPTGYNAFYLMKYEISQGQYCDFLNTLAPAQARNRIRNNYGSYRNYIKLASNGSYGCDANDDAGAYGLADMAKMNQSADGEWVACNYISWEDGAAYADWAALRPFTELEFEKAARGSRAVVAFEYAWGNASLKTATSALIRAATISEVPNRGNLNYSSCKPNGPFRCGSYADMTSARQNAGYGVMDLSGNLWERPVSVMDSETARIISTFTGEPGDGILSVNGNANTSNWPGLLECEVTGASGSGFRGGDWVLLAQFARLSDRSLSAFGNKGRYYSYGGRCARTAP